MKDIAIIVLTILVVYLGGLAILNEKIIKLKTEIIKVQQSMIDIYKKMFDPPIK